MGEQLPGVKRGGQLRLRQGLPAWVSKAVGPRLGRGCDASATMGGWEMGGGFCSILG